MPAIYFRPAIPATLALIVGIILGHRMPPVPLPRLAAPPARGRSQVFGRPEEVRGIFLSFFFLIALALSVPTRALRFALICTAGSVIGGAAGA